MPAKLTTPGPISQPGDREPGCGVADPPCGGHPRRPAGLVLAQPLDMGGHDDPGVQDVYQALAGHHLDRAPKLPAALAAARKAGHAFVVIGGTLIPTGRVAADRPFYPGKHRRHGMNLQVISSPHGEILWVSGPLPGAAHDLTCARIWGIIRQLAAAGLIVLAGKGYTGAGEHVRHPYRGRNKPASQKAANCAHAKLRAPGERASAQLKTWGILRKLRCCPWRAGQLAKAIHALQTREIAR